MWHTIICSATEWQNFFALRAHEAAEIHMQKIAYMMLDAYNANTPKDLDWEEWHIPFGDKFDNERINELLRTDCDPILPEHIRQTKIKIATARCARVSYINFEGKDDYVKDVELHDGIIKAPHASPFEHCAIGSLATRQPRDQRSSSHPLPVFLALCASVDRRTRRLADGLGRQGRNPTDSTSWFG